MILGQYFVVGDWYYIGNSSIPYELLDVTRDTATFKCGTPFIIYKGMTKITYVGSSSALEFRLLSSGDLYPIPDWMRTVAHIY